METRKVKELMVHLTEYATVSEDDNLYDAIISLKRAQDNYNKNKYKHRAVLVYDKKKKITGKVSAFDILRALEPKYMQFGHKDPHTNELSRFGLNKKFLSSLLEQYNLWDESLDTLVKKAFKLKIKEVMYKPSDGEYVNENAPIAEAIHQFILGRHQSLLVIKDGRIVGILRLSDVFEKVCNLIVK